MPLRVCLWIEVSDRETLGRHFGELRRVVTTNNGLGIKNASQGTPVWVCEDPKQPWSELWPRLRHM